MAEKETTKETPVEKITKERKNWEGLQNFAIFLAMIMGASKKSVAVADSPWADRMSDYLPESFTLEDESWRKLIQSSCDDHRTTKVENEFRRRLGKDPAKYDAGEYRRRLMHAKKEFLAVANKPAVENKKDARIQFKPITFRDPCNEFLNQLIAETETGGTDDAIYDRQREFAVRQNFLVPMKGWKRSIGWIRENKVTTLIGMFMLPWGIIQLISWLLTAY